MRKSSTIFEEVKRHSNTITSLSFVKALKLSVAKWMKFVQLSTASKLKGINMIMPESVHDLKLIDDPYGLNRPLVMVALT